MFYSGYQQSDLRGVSEFKVENNLTLPESFSIQNQINSPHDQGSLGICVSVCVSDICRYLYRGQGKEWNHPLSYFYDKRQDTSLDGMTPREALEIAVSDGFIKSFARVGNAAAIEHSILANGPVMIGLPVWGSFRDEFWTQLYGDSLEGYHAVTLVGYGKKSFVLRNSWGLEFGYSGYVDFPKEDLVEATEAWTVFS